MELHRCYTENKAEYRKYVTKGILKYRSTIATLRAKSQTACN